MVLVGNLKDLKLANIIQINCIERNVARVIVTTPDRKGYIYFAEGKIVHAEFHPFVGEKAVYEMLALTDGQFKVEAGIQAPSQTITRPWNSVVLEGLRIIDEKNQQVSPIPVQWFQIISSYQGVLGVAVVDFNGQLIEGKLHNEKKPLIFTFIWYKIKKMLTLFYSEDFQYAYIRMGDHYLFIFEVKPNLVLVETELDIDIHLFVLQVKKLLKRVTR